jgi:hypothetical protein
MVYRWENDLFLCKSFFLLSKDINVPYAFLLLSLVIQLKAVIFEGLGLFQVQCYATIQKE